MEKQPDNQTGENRELVRLGVWGESQTVRLGWGKQYESETRENKSKSQSGEAIRKWKAIRQSLWGKQ